MAKGAIAGLHAGSFAAGRRAIGVSCLEKRNYMLEGGELE